MTLRRNQSLKAYNTFGIDVNAKLFSSVRSEEGLIKVLKQCYASELFVLGGGSNILLSKDLDRTVLHINLKGKSILNETDNTVIVRAQAGENWHEFVRYCVENDFGGLENLSLIPGNVGTSPIQNIGAYGVELQDTFVECKAVHVQTLEKKTFIKEDCKFGYRNSIFKNELKGRYIITSVIFKLTKKHHQLHTDYGSILNELDAMKIDNPTIEDISNAVINIRQRKLPNPAELGNSGSFFKNPIVEKTKFEKLQTKYPEIPSYKIDDNHIKIPAGWLIDQAGFKGYREGDAGVHKNQALVLVNYGNATGEDILNLAKKIQKAIKMKYGLNLEMEVNLIS